MEGTFRNMHCPYCKSSDTWRLEPYPWMGRIRPRMRNRRCSNCGHEFAVWNHRFCCKHRTAQRIVFLYQIVLWILVVGLLVDVYTMVANPDSSLLLKAYRAVLGLF